MRTVVRRARCHREFSRWPSEHAPWFAALHAAHVRQRLSRCLKCPHRGIDLSSIAPDATGHVTCPGHGLRWHVPTRELAPIPDDHNPVTHI